MIRTIGQTWVQLEFIPGYNGKTSISKWIVEGLVLGKTSSSNQTIETINEYTRKWRKIYEKYNSPNATSLRVENLQPFTNYTLRMYAQNVKGKSKPSKPTEIFQTQADVPSVAPEYLSVRSSSLTQNSISSNNITVLVKWSPIPTRKWNGMYNIKRR